MTDEKILGLVNQIATYIRENGMDMGAAIAGCEAAKALILGGFVEELKKK